LAVEGQDESFFSLCKVLGVVRAEIRKKPSKLRTVFSQVLSTQTLSVNCDLNTEKVVFVGLLLGA
jgi:hypothetical protein